MYVLAQLPCCKTNYVKKYGKWALITGATDGIGLAIAKELARRGHSIIIVGRNDQKLANCKEQVEKEGGNEIEVMTVKIDLSNPSRENYQNVKQLIDPDNRDIGLLINNAGVFPPDYRNFHLYDEVEFLNIVNVNILGVLNFAKMVLPGMVNRERGCIVNISSSAGCASSPYMNIYGPSKAFVDRFTSNLVEEYKSFPIDIIDLTPGAVQTKLFQGVNDQSWAHKETCIMPSPENFARVAINALSTRMSQFCGCFGHSLMMIIIKIIPTSLSTYMIRKSLAISSSKFKPSYYKPKRDKLLDPSGRGEQVNQAGCSSSGDNQN